MIREATVLESILDLLADTMPSRRDYFAAAALTGFCQCDDASRFMGEKMAVARAAFELADAMIEVAKEKQ